MIEKRAINVIATEDLRPWLAEHGIDIDQALSAVIRLDRREYGPVSAWLDVEFYLLNSAGRPYRDETSQDVATGTASVPLRSWPPLTPAG